MAIIRHRQGYVRMEPDPPPDNTAPAYEHDQTVEVDPREAAPQHGNSTGINLRTLYDAWNAAYRGLAPHQINPTPITDGAATSDAPTETSAGMDDNPKPFVEIRSSGSTIDAVPVPETVAEGDVPDDVAELLVVPDVRIIDDVSTVDTYFRAYQMQVGAGTPVLLVAQQDYRSSIHLINVGNQNVYIGDNVSRGIEGYPLRGVGAQAGSELVFNTNRHVWAVADPAAGANTIPVNVLITYERRNYR